MRLMWIIGACFLVTSQPVPLLAHPRGNLLSAGTTAHLGRPASLDYATSSHTDASRANQSLLVAPKDARPIPNAAVGGAILGGRQGILSATPPKSDGWAWRHRL
jgi:hypothetical protein